MDNCLIRHFFMGFSLLVAAVFFMSCSRGETVPDQAGLPIEFTTVPQVGLRSGDRADGFVEGDQIGVLAYYVPPGKDWDDYRDEATPDFMYNRALSYDGQSWTYSPVMYWPQAEGARLNFYVYYPYSDGSGQTGVKLSSDSAVGEPSFEFVLNESADVDLMVAANEEKTAKDGSVVLNFRHLLTKVQFGFNVSNEGGFSYIVNKIVVKSTPTEATYSWYSDSFEVNATGTIEVFAGEDGGDHLIDSTEPRIIDDFTMFLLPDTLEEIEVSINNEDPQSINIGQSLRSGLELTVNLEVDLTGIKFTTSVSDWQDGGIATGGIS